MFLILILSYPELIPRDFLSQTQDLSLFLITRIL
jgi:hypothetical protein